MKNIPATVYEQLTPKQRVVAYVEALARADDAEQRRLVNSCPRRAYGQMDRRFTDAMETLMDMAMAVEADLKECALRFFVLFRVDPKESVGFLQDFANIRAAWKMTLTAMGIDEEAMLLAGPPSSPVFELIEALVPEPQLEESEALSGGMLIHLGQVEARVGEHRAQAR